MPRKLNRECQSCAAEPSDSAKAKPCWKDEVCRARRSYYKNRPENLSKKRTRHRAQKAMATENAARQPATKQVRVTDYPLLEYREPPELSMIFYRDRANGPIHALEFCVTERGELVRKVKAKHLKGVPQRHLRSHIKQVIALLQVEFGEELLISESRQPIALCPICASSEDKRDN